MKIYTKTGDDGTTGLFGGKRVAKFSLRIEAYGTVDELNAVIGVALTHDLPAMVGEPLQHISSLLFTVGSDLATPQDAMQKSSVPVITEEHVDVLEQWIDTYQEHLPALRNFILPGGSKGGAHLHLARTVCRRAERAIVALKQEEEINPIVLRFINRLSDYLFVAARFVNAKEGHDDIEWKS
ncbi:MAG: cob(I)yrinic acid a,c-diamide adenosyltransferase [Ignavibacteria bacterium]|jgi:cob(I)alamin adenosyltransferase